MEKGVRRVSAVAAALVAGVVAYLLGLRQSRLVRLEEKRAEVLAELSGLLFVVEDKYRTWYAPSLRSPEAGHTMDEIKGKVRERARATLESLGALNSYYQRNVAWLDPDLADRIDSVVTELEEMLLEYGKVGLANTHYHVSEGGVEAAKRMEERIPKIRKELIDEFRGIVRPLTAWSILRALATTPSGQRGLPAQDNREDE